MLGVIERLVSRAVNSLAWLAALILFAIMAMTFLDVIGRNFFGRSLRGTVETVSLMMGALVFCGLAITELNRKHIVVETFQGLFPGPLRRVSAIVNSVLAVGVGWLLLEQLFVKTQNVLEEGEYTMVLKIPYWPSAVVMLLGFTAFFVLLILRLLREVQGKEGPSHGD
jgi:TRAP-type C4-dicarboxylate transport system permease small subunit